MQDFLADPEDPANEIRPGLRVYFREISEFLPESSYITKELALHCLTTRYYNTFCIYHCYHDKRGTINDENPPASHQLTGVPWVRDANPKNRPAGTPLITRDPKVLHCGCYEDDALWDFFWWKTGILGSPASETKENWKSTRLEPRARGFMVQFVQNMTCLEIDDIYSETTDPCKTQLRIFRKMEQYIMETRMALEAELQRVAIL